MRIMPRSIRTRVIYTMLLVLLITGLGFVMLINSIVRSSFAEMELEAMRRDSLRVYAALDANVEWLESVSGDWARWTDSYEYLAGTNPTYVEDNLSPESMRILGADFMAYLDRDGAVYHISVLDRATGQPVVASPAFEKIIEDLAAAVYESSDRWDLRSGQVLLPAGPASVALQGITRSNGEAPHNGILVVGAYLDYAQVEELKRLTQLNITVVSPMDRAKVLGPVDNASAEQTDRVYVEQRGPGMLASWATVKGIDNEPALLYVVSEPRSAMQRASDTLRYVSLGLLGIVTLSGIAIAMVLEFAVMRRLTGLHQQVSEIGKLEATDRRVTVEGDDEIADIATALNANLESLAEAEDALKHAADHDYLTGLANRRRFELDVEKALAEAERTGESLAWVLIDLDEFKAVNDTLGHHCGDSVLMWFGDMMCATIRRYSTIARLGGDEFAILLPHSNEYDAAVVADRLLTALAEARCGVCDAPPFRVDASVGIAVAPRDGTTVVDLSRAADDAMYHAKLSRSQDRASRSSDAPSDAVAE